MTENINVGLQNILSIFYLKGKRHGLNKLS